jgi:hypothetical protein
VRPRTSKRRTGSLGGSPLIGIRYAVVILVPIVLATACGGGATATHSTTPKNSTSAVPGVAESESLSIRSASSRQAYPSEVRHVRSGRPKAVRLDEYRLRFPLSGNGCKPVGISAHIESKTLRLRLRPAHHGCTLPAIFYEVTVTLSRPELRASNVTQVAVRYGRTQKERMPLVVRGS